MNLSQLQYFTTLARIGHFGKAAEELCITQPSLSYAISQLETELGVTLIERKKRPFGLTEEGRLFLHYAQRSLDALNEGVTEMKRLAKGEGTVRLGFLRTLGVSFIPGLAADYLKKQPDPDAVRFEFHSGISAPLLQALKEETLDLVFCTKDDTETSIEFLPVASQDLVLIVPRNHPLSRRYAVDLIETLPYPQIFFSPSSGLRLVIDGLFQKIDKEPQIAYESEEDLVIAGLVAQGFGIAVVPYMDEFLRMDVKILQISSPVWERTFYMATLKERHLTPLAEQFKAFVTEKTKLSPHSTP